jgi:hypothetical protein
MPQAAHAHPAFLWPIESGVRIEKPAEDGNVCERRATRRMSTSAKKVPRLGLRTVGDTSTLEGLRRRRVKRLQTGVLLTYLTLRLLTYPILRLLTYLTLCLPTYLTLRLVTYSTLPLLAYPALRLLTHLTLRESGLLRPLLPAESG